MISQCSGNAAAKSVPCGGLKEAWRPKFSKQGNKERNCGQHCVAMITHLPVPIIAAVLNNDRGTDTRELVLALYWFGVTSEWKLTPYRARTRLPQLCILHVQHHWCLYFDPSNSGNGMIYDSCIGIFPKSEDKRRIKSYLKIEIPK